MISLTSGTYTTVTPIIDHAKTFLVVLWTEGATGRFTKKHFTQVRLLKNLVDTFETMFPYLSVDLVWLLCKSKEGDGFQGWHKDVSLGQQITKTIVINVGSKERDNEEITGSFDNDVSFKADDWKAIEECALGLGGLTRRTNFIKMNKNQQLFQPKIHQSHNLQ
jgi:hypothetical protein